MLLLDDASQVVKSSVRQLGSERVDIAVAIGRILTENVISDIDMPPFDRSAMDGYALCGADGLMSNEHRYRPS